MTKESVKTKDKNVLTNPERCKRWRLDHKEHIKQYNLKYRQTNSYILYRKRYNKKHWQQNKEQISLEYRKRYLGAKCYINFNRRITFAKSREALFHILGHFCSKCGHPDKRVLQFDHINGGGTKEHKTDFLNSRLHFYQFYAHNPTLARQRLQILCANCNVLKRFEGRML